LSHREFFFKVCIFGRNFPNPEGPDPTLVKNFQQLTKYELQKQIRGLEKKEVGFSVDLGQYFFAF